MRISITLAIVAITVLVSWRAFGDRRLLERLILWPPAVERGRQYDRLLTYGFVHADWMHLLFNMLALWSFGTAVEQVFTQWLGPLGYVLFYLSAIRPSTASLRTPKLVSSTHRLPKVLVRYQNAMITPFIACGAWL